MSENIENIQEAIKQINICNQCVRQYEATKIMLGGGVEIDIPAAIISQLKQKFVAARSECKAALDAITG